MILWNARTQFIFDGNNDIVKFIKMIGEQGLYVTLRVGPYIEAEWNAGYVYTASFLQLFVCFS